MIAKTGGIMETMESPEAIGFAGLQCSAVDGGMAGVPVPLNFVPRPVDGSTQSVGHPRIPGQGAPAPRR
jgi:hypothetical protein